MALVAIASQSAGLLSVEPFLGFRATMKTKLLFFLLGLLATPLLAIGAFFSLVYFEDYNSPLFREQHLISGKTIKVISFLLAWGIEHSERFPEQDGFSLEYVSSILDTDSELIDKEAVEVFELIRPVSEQWEFKSATLSAFRSTARNGQYYIFAFTQAANGAWSFQRSTAKVHINDSAFCIQRTTAFV